MEIQISSTYNSTIWLQVDDVEGQYIHCQPMKNKMHVYIHLYIPHCVEKHLNCEKGVAFLKCWTEKLLNQKWQPRNSCNDVNAKL